MTRDQDSNGRYTYTVGDLSRTSKKQYRYAAWGEGNEHHPSDLWLTLGNSAPTISNVARAYGGTVVDLDSGSSVTWCRKQETE